MAHCLQLIDASIKQLCISDYNLSIMMEPLPKPPPDSPSEHPAHSNQVHSDSVTSPAENLPRSGSKSEKSSSAFSARNERKGVLYQLWTVTLFAALIATFFTAWTPGRPNMLFGASDNQANALLTPLPSPTGVPGEPTPTMKNPRLIGIVAGHWKNDSGAVCADGLKEVDINLDVATQVQKILSDAGYQVDLLNEFDSRLQGYHAAALISIHNDSCDFINNEATGFKVASAFASKHPERSARLTACLRARYSSATKLPVHSTSVTPDMSSYHAFDEISENTPASIIETGFLNLDRTMLTQHSDLVAKGVAEGILCYMRNESISVTPTEQPTPVAP